MNGGVFRTMLAVLCSRMFARDRQNDRPMVGRGETAEWLRLGLLGNIHGADDLAEARRVS